MKINYNEHDCQRINFSQIYIDLTRVELVLYILGVVNSETYCMIRIQIVFDCSIDSAVRSTRVY